ncbi:MAG: DNA internalization-related competence protein ComEC/Rec2 [Firmicutes bacterium]|nr:DNA internalization-related competence protein ComEC/Rec2 [Bacillota bacterium]
MPRLKIILQSKIFIILSLLFILSYIILFTKIIKYSSIYDDGFNEITGTLIEYKIDGDKLSFILKAKEKITGTYYFKTLEEKINAKEIIELGMKIKVAGTVSVPKNNNIPNTFNYKKFLYNKKIYKIMSVNKIEFKEKNKNFVYNIKNIFLKRIDSFKNCKNYIYAFIMGESGYIDNDVYQIYQKNGVTHLFAVSGMHISFLVVALNNILKKLKFKEIYINILIIIFLCFYMFLIGFTASVVRACLLYILLLFNQKLNIKLNNITVLYLIFIFLVLIDPFFIYDIGFIYSFLTSFGLMLFGKKITGNYILKLLKTSTVAFLFSLPLTLYNFYEVNLLTIINNIIVVPIVSLVLFPLTLITFILPFLESILNIGFLTLEFINSILNNLRISLVVPKINIMFVAVYYFGMYNIYKGKYKYIFLFLMLIIVYKSIPYINNSTYLYFLDVGQGDSTIIITEHTKDVILIDTGGKINYDSESWKLKNKSYNLSDYIITLLKSLGIEKISTMLITHGDYDHMGEAINLVNDFKVEKVILNCGEYNDLEKELINVLNKKKIPYYSCIKELKIDDNKLYFLNNNDYGNENDNSSVVYTELNNYKFLFMGDAGIEVEEDLIKKYNLQNIDVLKVGHHGSKTSSSKNFIDEIEPKYSIISVGKNNRYGHPNKDVLENLKESKIYRTDQDGSIMFKIKNNKLNIKTCSP